MVRKLVVRAFLAMAMVAGLGVTALAVVAYLALASPSYYANLRNQPAPSEAELDALKTEWEQEREAFLFWSQRAVARQASHLKGQAGQRQLAADNDYDPAEDVYTLRVTQDQLNALLASPDVPSLGDASHPRIALSKGRVDFAFELETPASTCVLSAGLQPTLQGDGTLRLDIASASVGRLSLPLNTLLGWLPRGIVHSSRDVEINLTPPAPHVVVNVAKGKQPAPQVKSLQCLDGALVVEFTAPVLPPQRATPLASATP